MMGRPVLTQANLQAHVTQLATQDIIWGPLYDSANYATNGQTSLSFFSTPQGQGTTTAPSGTGSKTIQDTNLTAAGQLTKGNAFYMLGQELVVFPGESPEQSLSSTAGLGASVLNNFVNDVYVLSKNGVLTLTIGSNRIYIQDGPLGQFPPATRLAVATAVATFTVTATTFNFISANYAVFSGEVYTVVPIYIDANLGFQENLTWAVAQAPPSANAARIFSRLRGYLNRNAQ